MTETTEEISEIERAQKLATLATEALYDEKKKVAELKRELEGLKFKAKDHAHQVNAIIQAKNKFQDENEALTKEIDELKEKIEPNEYYCTACRDCNWEGSSKFLRVSQFDECDITCPCCHSKNLVDTNIELNDNQSISNLHEYIDMQEFRISSIKSTSRVIANHNAHLKSQLSNREKEIKELKEQNESLKGALNVTSGVVTKEDLEWAKNALAGVQSKQGEE